MLVDEREWLTDMEEFALTEICGDTVITHLLRPRETVCFVDPRPSMLKHARVSFSKTIEIA